MRRHPVDANTPYLAGGATIVLLMVLFIGLFSTPILERLALGYTNFAAVISAVLVDLTNSDREQVGARRLAVNDTLTRAAQAKADDMARRGYFAHFDAEGRAPWDWIRDAGYEYKFAGENLAIQFSDSADVVEAWLNSPTHRENLLDTRFTEMGIAVAQGLYQGQPTIFVVQMFGTPLYTFSDAIVASAPESPLEESTLDTVSESTSPEGTAALQNISDGAVLARATGTPAVAPPSIAAAPTAVVSDPKQPVAVLGMSESYAPENTVQVAALEKHIPVSDIDVPMAVDEAVAQPAPSVASWWMHVFASPWSSVRYGAALALALFLALTIYSIVCELLQAHHLHGVYAASLYAAFVLVFFAADLVFFRAPEVPVSERVAFIERHETTLAFVRIPGAVPQLSATEQLSPQGSQVASAASASGTIVEKISRFLLDKNGWVLLVVMFLLAGSGVAWERYRRGEA